LSTNLFGEIDTPIAIYTLYQNMKNYRDYDFLLKEVEQIINEYPDRAEGYVLKGDILKKLDNYERALENYTIAIDMNVNNAAYYAIRARHYLNCGIFYDAIDDFTYLIENKKLDNQNYYASRKGGLRLIASCCIGNWGIAQEDIKYINQDYVFYAKPVKGIITKERLENSIKNKQNLAVKEYGDKKIGVYHSLSKR